MKLIESKTIGYQETTTFHGDVAREPLYELTAGCVELRRARSDYGIALRKAAEILGITAADLTGLETGRLVPEDEEVWERMRGQLLRSLTNAK